MGVAYSGCGSPLPEVEGEGGGGSEGGALCEVVKLLWISLGVKTIHEFSSVSMECSACTHQDDRDLPEVLWKGVG